MNIHPYETPTTEISWLRLAGQNASERAAQARRAGNQPGEAGSNQYRSQTFAVFAMHAKSAVEAEAEGQEGTKGKVEDRAPAAQPGPGDAWYRQAMEQLVGVVQELSLARDLDTVMDIVRRAARELTHADGATFVLRDNGNCFYAEENAITPLWKGRRFPMETCISGWVMLNRQSTVIEDIYADSRIPADAYRPTFVRSLAMVPIRTVDPIGAIGNYWARTYCPSAQQVKVLQALADTTAVAMENVRVYAELERRVRERTAELSTANRALRHEVLQRRKAEAHVRQLSVTDELTGVYNRRGFFQFAARKLNQARCTGQPAWVLFADVDGLKQINDNQGHEAGDELIKETARLLRAHFRTQAVIGRLGGDEFAVFFSAGEQRATATDALHSLRTTIERFNAPKVESTLSISLGITRCDGESSLEELIGRADAAMYHEKRHRSDRANAAAR